ncbi:SDR family oxidoreductase [Pseudoclavibacter chungangensis]|uniref:SDR family oxidoreductase n=1 Tax=Pseudoclavibacter chungangensis TaxID=587635 RepID=A0A7J5BST2_9MICO|nr:SDR family NAD(P)-dependent oxidoreductase [Pseudoclavibacter chungangensis]KAB1656024.1 SDR family oxidoreductase [Pseudoclavibacter chungangensis]NYJ66480.1 NAD(P)-dependent dehydrogenase (short-subunit alcohol dehydrogenase family) [Pseudoclavibacter chungangensis]
MTETPPVVVVTGAAQGIGLATARLLAERGVRVGVLDLPRARARDAAAQLDATSPVSGGHEFADVDVCDEDAVESAFASLADRHGVLAGLVNGAGILVKSPAERVDLGEWRRQLDVHLTGAMLCSRAAYPALVAGSGAIVNIASVGSTFGLPGRLAYATAKAGVLGLTRTLATEWGPRGVRVNAVAPGYIATEMVRAGLRTGALDESVLVGRTPLRRLGEPEEIASVIAFLLSTDASFVNGAVLDADGGITVDGSFNAVDDQVSASTSTLART